MDQPIVVTPAPATMTLAVPAARLDPGALVLTQQTPGRVYMGAQGQAPKKIL